MHERAHKCTVYIVKSYKKSREFLMSNQEVLVIFVSVAFAQRLRTTDLN